MNEYGFKFNYIRDKDFAERIVDRIDYEENYAEHLVNTLIKEKANKLQEES